MSIENLKSFYNKISTDENLQKRLESISISTSNNKIDQEQLNELIKTKLIPFAKEEGFEFTFEEYKEFEKNLINEETVLNEEILDSVYAGGSKAPSLCVAIGGGNNCFCFIVGAGNKTNTGSKFCFCITAGLSISNKNDGSLLKCVKLS